MFFFILSPFFRRFFPCRCCIISTDTVFTRPCEHPVLQRERGLCALERDLHRQRIHAERRHGSVSDSHYSTACGNLSVAQGIFFRGTGGGNLRGGSSTSGFRIFTGSGCPMCGGNRSGTAGLRTGKSSGTPDRFIFHSQLRFCGLCTGSETSPRTFNRLRR